MASSLLRRGTLLNFPAVNVQPLGSGVINSVVSPTDLTLLADKEDLVTQTPTWSIGANTVDLSQGRVIIPSVLVGNSSYGPITFINGPTGRTTRVTVTVVNDATGNASLTFANTSFVDAGLINPAAGASTTFNLFTVDGTNFLGQVASAATGGGGGGGPLTSISGTPVSGYALTSTGVAGQGKWAAVTATTLGGVSVTGSASVNNVLTATGTSAAHWAAVANSPLTVATGLDPTQSTTAATNNSRYLTTLIQSVANSSTGTGGFIYIPPANTPYLLASEVEVLDHVFLFGQGYDWMKRQGIGSGNYAQPAATIFAAASNFQSSPARGMFHFNNNGGLLNLSIFAGAVQNGAASASYAPIGVWVSGAGNLFQNVVVDGGMLGWLNDNTGPNNSKGDEGIDNNYYNCYWSQNSNKGTTHYVTHATNNPSSGNVVVVNSVTGIFPGMHVIDLSNNGHLDADTIVHSVSGASVTLSAGRAQLAGLSGASPAINGALGSGSSADTLLFLQSATCVMTSSDVMIHGLRNITGTYICGGADTMHIGCHFSEGGNNKNPVYCVIHKAGQGATYSGCTFDVGSDGDGAAAHILKVSGGILETGGRIQSGVDAGYALPHIHDICNGSANTFILSCHVPAIGSPLDALIAYSPAIYDNGTNGWISIVGNTAAVSNTNSYSRVMIDAGAIAGGASPRFITKNTGASAPTAGTKVAGTGPYTDAAVGATGYTT